MVKYISYVNYLIVKEMQLKPQYDTDFKNHYTGRDLKIDNGVGKDWERQIYPSGRGTVGALSSTMAKISKTGPLTQQSHVWNLFYRMKKP